MVLWPTTKVYHKHWSNSDRLCSVYFPCKHCLELYFETIAGSWLCYILGVRQGEWPWYLVSHQAGHKLSRCFLQLKQRTFCIVVPEYWVTGRVWCLVVALRWSVDWALTARSFWFLLLFFFRLNDMHSPLIWCRFPCHGQIYCKVMKEMPKTSILVFTVYTMWIILWYIDSLSWSQRRWDDAFPPE